ncbi:uncharacterized protein [Gossypium hirsutum]|uniref:Uncharacterized protein n=1 Tax=Gossypium hirsutum TaxID=3635 RepID=A0A1U8NQ62_GOSHI|nr:uncharacterized protein LOC107949963 [Gossypium hirsutum]
MQQDMSEKMRESQEDMMAKLTKLLTGGGDKGKGPMADGEEGNEDESLYPPGFTLLHARAQAEYPHKPAVTIRPQQSQAGASNFQVGLGSNPRNHPTNFAIPDFDEVTEKERINEELLKQLEERCKWLEEKFKAMEVNENYRGIDAKELSLVPDLAPFITHMLGSATKSLPDIVMNGEMIENAIRSGKIDAGESNRRLASKKKENGVNNASMYNKGYSRSITVNEPRKVAANQQSSSRQEAGARESTESPKFTPIPMSYRELYQNLFDAHVVSPFYLKPLQPLSLKIKADIADVKNSLSWVWKEMVKSGLIVSEGDHEQRRNYCEFHHEMGHEIQECAEFRAMVQCMMDNKEMEFCEGVQEESHVCASESTSEIQKANYPVVIISRPKNSEAGARVTPKVIIQKSAVFTYKDNNKVPWNYDCNVTILGKEDVISKKDQDEEPTKDEASTEKKGNVVELRLLVNEPVKEEKAREFLKFLKHSEYNIVEQLHKQPARISVLALLLSSEGHQNALLKVLNETYVADDISANKLDRLVGNISADNFIFFNDDEIPPGGMGSTRALHITTRCKGYTLPGVLVDNGSALNVLPLSTLDVLMGRARPVLQ